jgi:hypothetical protein
MRSLFDVGIYGATASGVMAAVAAGRRGARVALVEPSAHVGGMVTGGLGHTDLGREQSVIGGYAGEFFAALGDQYGKKDQMYDFEPRVARAVLLRMLSDSGSEFFEQSPILAATKIDNCLQSIEVEGGPEIRASVWIDASYEGDLMKHAGVTYRVGREGRDEYQESLAGRQDLLPGHHQFALPVSAVRDDGSLLPFLEAQEKLAPTGAGDGKFQSYCYRLCLTDNPENRVPIPPPKRYCGEDYELARRYVRVLGESASLGHFLGIARLPNGKADINSQGPVSTDLLGQSWDYPEATRVRRQEIADAHLEWAHGLIWFLQHDPAVPFRLREEMLRWGLCKDEFPETGHWPPQLYVREGRKMRGEYLVTQRDLMEDRSKFDSIGIANYNIDIREVQWISHLNYRYPNACQEVFMEGYLSVPVEPWEIPYRALLPRFHECRNLIVPVCASMTTVAFASFRMEPQYMIAGHSAGTAAALAFSRNIPCHHVPIGVLQQELRREGQMISREDLPIPSGEGGTRNGL